MKVISYLAVFLAAAYLIKEENCWAQDNYNHGPRAGYVRGQGEPLLIELVPDRSQEGFSLYFLDNQWVDLPMTEISLNAFLHPKGSKAGSPIPCTKEAIRFKCAFAKGKLPSEKDVIKISVTNAKKPPVEYSYEYPLKY